MTSRLNPYISFRDNAKEAMEFYQGVFGGSLTMNTFGDFGAEDAAEAPEADKIMHAMLETDSGFTLMGADTPPGMEHRRAADASDTDNPGDNVSVSLSGDDADELRRYWTKLTDGGTTTIPLEKQVWGDEFGACVDRFGIGWLVNIAQPQA